MGKVKVSKVFHGAKYATCDTIVVKIDKVDKQIAVPKELNIAEGSYVVIDEDGIKVDEDKEVA